MLEMFLLFVGGTVFAAVAGAKSLDSAATSGEKKIADYGRRVEARTKACCDEEAAESMARVMRANEKAAGRFAKEAGELIEQRATAARAEGFDEGAAAVIERLRRPRG